MHHQQAAFHFYGQEWTVGGCIVAMSLLLLHHSFEGLHHYFPSRPTTRIIIFSKRCIFRFKLGGHRQSIDFQDNDAIGFFCFAITYLCVGIQFEHLRLEPNSGVVWAPCGLWTRRRGRQGKRSPKVVSETTATLKNKGTVSYSTWLCLCHAFYKRNDMP